MRNLKVVQKQKKAGVLFSTACQTPTVCLGDHGSVLVCSEGTLSRFVTHDDVEAQILCEQHDMLQDVVQMQYISTTGSTYLVNGRGSFLQLMMHEQGVEELFQSEEGIVYFAVSPDSRFVAIVTKQNTLLLLTLPDLEVISQLELTEGGGQTGTEVVSVVWREDAHYFAVNYKNGEKFQIKIFDENGTFHSKTEEENALLDSTLEWQPSGALLAGIGRTPHGTVISLFEKNGLKRADFFPYEGKKESYEDNKIVKLTWNTTSNILAVVYKSKVELWCRNNYVWMRKLVLYGSSSESGVTSLTFSGWDREINNRINIIDDQGSWCVYDVAFTYTSGYSAGAAIVASWNGNSVYATPFRDSCCPPPHCLYQLTYDADIKAVIIPEFWSGLLCVTSDGQLIFLKYEKNELKQIRSVNIPKFDKFSESKDWLWPYRNTICYVSKNSVTALEFESADFENVEKAINITSKTFSPANQSVVSIFSAVNNKEDSSILIQTENGTVFKLSLNDGNLVKVCKFSQVCTDIQPLSETFIIGHDPLTRKLFVGWSRYPEFEPIIINNDSTSFTTFQSSLIYTTIQGSLEIRNEEYVRKLTEKLVLGNEFNNDEESSDRYSRKCEKGSMIVRCCLNKMLEPSLILQIIPRGNLEIIYPRPLLIDAVKIVMREKENNSRYEKIMAALRRHRIDYRVLIDEMRVLIREDQDCYLEELLKTMIEQVKDSHSLVLLVTDMNQDYADCILAIKIILEGVLKNNTDTRMVHVEESYLASLAKLGLLEEALKSSLILEEGENKREIVQHRVKFLSFYCENPDVLFDTALGTYDMSLASLVADCLGKDPKEYIPVLDGFQSMLELKRRFKIDDKLRRYAKAVINLVRDSRVQHDEIIKYMERHRLFTDVIKFLTRKLKFDEGGVVERSGDDTGLLLREAQCSYAQYLEERGKLLEASIFFRDSENMDKAIECSKKSGNWEFALELAYESAKSEDEIKDIFQDAVLQLEDKKMYGDAARLCELYLADPQQAVYYWIKDKKWQRAATLCLKSTTLGKSFRDENLKPKLLEASEEQKEIIQHTMEDIDSKLQRLNKVKESKAKKLAESGGFGDTFSDTESYLSGTSTSGSIASSNASGKTYRSGKNKRKLERKVYSLKEGSKYEDLAIIAHLWTVMDKILNELKPDVSNTVESLWKFGQDENAIVLCENLEKLLHTADRCILEVWSTPITEELLESKFRIPPVMWTPGLNKLALHDPSSKSTVR